MPAQRNTRGERILDRHRRLGGPCCVRAELPGGARVGALACGPTPAARSRPVVYAAGGGEPWLVDAATGKARRCEGDHPNTTVIPNAPARVASNDDRFLWCMLGARGPGGRSPRRSRIPPRPQVRVGAGKPTPQRTARDVLTRTPMIRRAARLVRRLSQIRAGAGGRGAPVMVGAPGLIGGLEISPDEAVRDRGSLPGTVPLGFPIFLFPRAIELWSADGTLAAKIGQLPPNDRSAVSSVWRSLRPRAIPFWIAETGSRSSTSPGGMPPAPIRSRRSRIRSCPSPAPTGSCDSTRRFCRRAEGGDDQRPPAALISRRSPPGGKRLAFHEQVPAGPARAHGLDRRVGAEPRSARSGRRALDLKAPTTIPAACCSSATATAAWLWTTGRRRRALLCRRRIQQGRPASSSWTTAGSRQRQDHAPLLRAMLRAPLSCGAGAALRRRQALHHLAPVQPRGAQLPTVRKTGDKLEGEPHQRLSPTPQPAAYRLAALPVHVQARRRAWC